MADEFKIERGIPMPDSLKDQKPKPPVEQMEVGDSILVKAKAGMGATNKLLHTARGLGLKSKFKSGLVSDGLYRVWRVS